MSIAILNNETIGKIAAGEVVERPASVVKELLENAIDAGATRISVAIEAGGTRSIEVSDNGVGIGPAELSLALERHATSKLIRFDDLDRLTTLGFRGEALPSIAAVSRMRIRSRTYGQTAAAELEANFGYHDELDLVAGDFGTTVLVRDLFENVPARRKFQRQPSTESGIVVRVVGAYAAAYPDRAFSLTLDDRRAFGTSGTGDLVESATAIYGPETGRAAIELMQPDAAVRVPGIEATGWLCVPAVNRSHRQSIVFFLNGRLIQSRPLSYSLEEAYHTLLMVGRHPVALIRIEVDPTLVDVNVHPTKVEVKFADERAVARAISRTAHQTLTQVPQSMPPRIRIEHIGQASGYSQRGTEPIGNPFSQIIPSRDETAPAGSVTKAPARSKVPLLRVLGQIASTYIIAEGPEGLYLIDQHAAHERVVYERFLAQLADRSVDTQPMLDPLVVDLTAEELSVVEQSREELNKLGFDLEQFGEAAIVVRSVPSVAIGTDIEERLRLVLRELNEGGAGSSWLDSVAVSVACHTSIRAGQVLSLQEMRELVEQLERTEQPRACGHGRPTMLQLTQSELERQFGRG